MRLPLGMNPKKDYDAVYLVTKHREYVIRRIGSEWKDYDLIKLVGKNVSVSGLVKDYLILSKNIKILKPNIFETFVNNPKYDY